MNSATPSGKASIIMRWDGVIFREEKSPKYHLRKKQNPVRSRRTVCPVTSDIPLSRPTGQSVDEPSDPTGHTDGDACLVPSDISRVNHSATLEYSNSPTLEWSTPILTELLSKGEGRGRVRGRQPETSAHPLHRGCMDGYAPVGNRQLAMVLARGSNSRRCGVARFG
jgi:hypothetical protein